MPEQTPIVSGGNPGLIQAFKPSKGESKTTGDSSESGGSLFSSNLGKALEQQRANATASPSPGQRSTERLQVAGLSGLKEAVNASGTKQVESVNSGPLLEGSAQSALAEDDVTANLLQTDVEVSVGNIPSTLNEQSAIAGNAENADVSVVQNAEVEHYAPLTSTVLVGDGAATLQSEPAQALKLNESLTPLPGAGADGAATSRRDVAQAQQLNATSTSSTALGGDGLDTVQSEVAQALNLNATSTRSTAVAGAGATTTLQRETAPNPNPALTSSVAVNSGGAAVLQSEAAQGVKLNATLAPSQIVNDDGKTAVQLESPSELPLKSTMMPSVPLAESSETTTVVALNGSSANNLPDSLTEATGRAMPTAQTGPSITNATAPGAASPDLAAPLTSVSTDTRVAAVDLSDKQGIKAAVGLEIQQPVAPAVLNSPAPESLATSAGNTSTDIPDGISATAESAKTSVLSAPLDKVTLLQPSQVNNGDVKPPVTNNEVGRQPEVTASQLQLNVEAANKEAAKTASTSSQGVELATGRLPLFQTAELEQPLAPRLAAHRLNANGINNVASNELPQTALPVSAEDAQTLMSAPDGKTTVQQRIATAEALLSKMSADTGDAVLNKASADSSLTALPVANVAAATGARTDAMSAPVIQAPFNIPLESADAESALTGNVKWMANEGVKNAFMTVTPNGMGPISVKIGIEGDNMEVSITATQQNTREALESMLPRLREQLAVQGHESVKVDVSDGKGEQSRPGNGQTFADSRGSAGSGFQENQSNGSNHQEKTEYGRTSGLDVVPDSFMAEDLQRVGARVTGENHDRPVFDAYV